MAGRGGYGAQPGSPNVTGPGRTSAPSIVESEEEKPLVYDESKSLEDNVIGLMDSNLSSETKDYLVEYWLNEQASKNSYQRELDASSTQYQRAVADLRKAGISPFLAFDSLRGSGVSSSAGSVSGGYSTERKNQSAKNSVDVGGKIATVIAIIAAAVIAAL